MLGHRPHRHVRDQVGLDRLARPREQPLAGGWRRRINKKRPVLDSTGRVWSFNEAWTVRDHTRAIFFLGIGLPASLAPMGAAGLGAPIGRTATGGLEMMVGLAALAAGALVPLIAA